MVGVEEQDDRYHAAAAAFGPAIDRLAGAWEANAADRRDLVQEIHVALWRSFAGFDGRCSVRTWVFRVAHNVAVGHVLKQRRRPRATGTLEHLDALPAPDDPEALAGERQALSRLATLIQHLGPPDRQVMLLYLEDFDAASIGEITGLSAGAVATKIHRLKGVLARQFKGGPT